MVRAPDSKSRGPENQTLIRNSLGRIYSLCLELKEFVSFMILYVILILKYYLYYTGRYVVSVEGIAACTCSNTLACAFHFYDPFQYQCHIFATFTLTVKCQTTIN